LQDAINDLQSELDGQNRGVQLVEVAGGYQLRTTRANADWVKKFLGGRPARMGKATLETLAIVAYRQPITRAEIEAIRGVDVDGVIATLLERNLIRAVARKDVPGRPFLYGTTGEFLQLFNLKDLTHLPTLKEMEEISLPEIPGDVISLDQLEEK
jgi:segregation and condensation protein B